MPVHSNTTQKPGGSFRFVTVLGRHSDLSAWPIIEAELKKNKIFYSTNIGDIAEGRIVGDPDVLENLRNPKCIGVVAFLSDDYFRYLDTVAASEKSVLLDHFQHRRPSFCITGVLPLSDRPEFNFNRIRYRPETSGVFVQDFRAWIQDPALGEDDGIEFHPDIFEILVASFGPSVDDFGLISRRNDNIQYKLFRYRDKIHLSTNYVLYLPPNITISKTAEHFLEHYGGLVGNHTFLVLIDPKNVQNRDSWMRTVKACIRECSNALFLDDFVKLRFAFNPTRQISTASEHIITPRLKSCADGKIIDETFDYMLAAVKRSSRTLPVILIQGPGGVGKTTLCDQLSQRMTEPGSYELIPLGALDIVRKLSESPELGVSFTLFNLLRAMFPPGEIGALGEQEFAWIFDTGRVSFVIDGIDEIIPRLRDSDAIDVFFDSIVRYSNHLRRGKIVLTCRNASFMKEHFRSDVEQYEIQPFDEQLVDRYIDVRFPGLPLLQKGARRFLAELGPSNSILPFVLRVVCDSVQDGLEEDDDAPSLLESDVLDLGRKMDFVIAKVCEREEAKYEYSRFLGAKNPVDVQCEFFIQLAIPYQGSCERQCIETYLRGFNLEFDNTTIERFYDHPLLSCPHRVYFRFDVVQEFFLGLGFARSLLGKEEFTIAQLSDIPDKCQYRSPFLVDLATRVGKLTDHVLLEIIDLISQAHHVFSERGRSEEYYRHASAMLNVALQIMSTEKKAPSVEHATRLIKDLFGGGTPDSPMVGAAFHNIPPKSGIRFDFSGLTLERTSIKNFEDFFRCTFSETTIFKGGRIGTGMVTPAKAKLGKTSATSINFVDCDIDNAFVQSMAKNDDKKIVQVEDAKKHLRNFLRGFRYQNSFNRKQARPTMQACYSTNTRLTFRDTVRICETANLIETDRQEVWIVPAELDNVAAFVHERLYRGGVKRAVTLLLEQLK